MSAIAQYLDASAFPQNDDAAGLDADYIVVEVAKKLLGPDRLSEYVRRANTGGIERVLV